MGPSPGRCKREMVPKPRLGAIVVDPLPVVRAALALMIDDLPDMDVLAQAGSAEDALEAVRRVRRTGVFVLVGLGLGGQHDSYWLIRTIHEGFPDLPILACGANADPLAISRALFSGADAFLDKRSDPVEFIESLRKGASGEMALAGPASEWVGAIAEGIERRRLVESSLTDRERQVLRVAAEGLTARQIASRLGVTERTVTTHLSRIYAKLGVGTRLAAVRLATDAGLVSAGTRQ
jgi:DNA-binding NarL/FixJ family response regulator